jgi:hypothetical protein
LVTGNEISIPTIHRSLRDFEYSFKRVQLIPERRNSMSNIEARFIYARNTMLIDVEKMMFIDEMGVNLSMRKRYGRAIVEESPRKSITTIRSKNFSVCAALKKSGLFNFLIREGHFIPSLFSTILKILLQS